MSHEEAVTGDGTPPGEPHLGHAPPEPLEHLIGTWDVEGDFLLHGTTNQLMSFGSATGTQILGGKCVQLAVTTQSDGLALSNSVCILSRNHVTGAFEFIHFNDEAASMTFLEGTWIQATHTLQLAGEQSNPALGLVHPLRATWDVSMPDRVELICEILLPSPKGWTATLRMTLYRR